LLPWILSPDEALALPLDELALSILRDAHANQEWNYRNWLLKAQQNAYPDRPDALLACAEAWGWLQAKGLIAPDPLKGSSEAFVISRRGLSSSRRV
jgi:hypothetical protein